MTSNTMKKTTEIQKIANNIDKGIEAFETRKAELIKLADQAKVLKIEDIEDREAIKEVSRMRKDLKNARVEIKNEGKNMRDPLTKMSKWIIEKENELVDIIQPVEVDLKSQEDWVKAEKERIKEEGRKKEEEKINKRINSLADLGFKIEYSELKTMTDEEFQELLNEAQEMYQAEQEKKRLEEERQMKIEQRKQALFDLGMNYSGGSKEFRHIYAINHTITLDTIETASDGVFDAMVESARQSIMAEELKIEKERQKREAEKAELERRKKESDEREAKLKEEREKIEAEKRAIEQAKALQKAKEEAAEKARKEAIAETKRKEDEKLEKERKAKERAERKAAMAPDKDKILAYVKSIKDIPVPELKMSESNSVMAQILSLVDKIEKFANEKVGEL